MLFELKFGQNTMVYRQKAMFYPLKRNENAIGTKLADRIYTRMNLILL